jgi:hypothetical protein
MRVPALVALACVLAVPARGHAAMNRSFLVPAYEECKSAAGNCITPTRSSSYTFDSIALYSSAKPYSAPKKTALIVVVKGLKDPAGSPVTGQIQFDTGTSRVTILGLVGTLTDNSPLVPHTYAISVTNGSAHFRYATPSDTPDHGLVVNTLTAPVVYDPDGKPLARTGTQSKP